MKKLIILFAMLGVISLIGASYYSTVVRNSTEASEVNQAEDAHQDGHDLESAEPEVTTSLDVEAIKTTAKEKPIKRSVPEGAVDVAPLIYGDTDAPIIIEEFASFTCSHCASFHRETLPKLKEALIDNGLAQLHVYSFPRNAQDLEVTMMIQCQETNDARKKFANAAMRGQEQWAGSADYQNGLKTIARVGGMSEEEYTKCVSDESLQDKIIASRQWYDKQVGVNATPYFRVGSEVVKGAQGVKEFEAAIQAELAK